jgi:hypothetical protein
MKLKHLTVLSLLGASCFVPNGTGSLIVVDKVIEATASSSGSSGSACVYDPTTEEKTFGIFDPAAGYVHGLVLENRLPDNSTFGPGRINTNDFQVEYGTVQYQVVSGPAQTLAQQTVPGNSLIPTGGKGVTELTLVPPGFVASGTTLRMYIQVYGRLLDGSKVKSNTYEYVVQAVSGFTMPLPTCSSGTAGACEGDFQDTGTGCF